MSLDIDFFVQHKMTRVPSSLASSIQKFGLKLCINLVEPLYFFEDYVDFANALQFLGVFVTQMIYFDRILGNGKLY
jgi:hypothetical protein